MFRLIILLMCLPMLSSAQKQRYLKLEKFLEQGKIKKAERFTERALLKDPDDGNVILVQAQLRELAGEHAEALHLADRGVSKGGDANKAAAIKGTAHAGMGQNKKAITLLEAIPKAERTHHMKYRLAMAYGQNGQNEEALATFGEILVEDPKNYRVLRERGTVHAMNGDTALAHTNFNKAIELAPNDPVNWNSRGFHYWARNGLHGRAIEDYNKAIKLNVNYAFAFNNRGWSKFKSGDKAGALRDIRLSEKKRPHNPYVQFNLGRIALADKQHEKACGHFQRTSEMSKAPQLRERVTVLMQQHCPTTPEVKVSDPRATPTDSTRTPEPIPQRTEPPVRSNAPGKK